MLGNSLELKSMPKLMKEYLHTLSLITDEKLIELMTKKGFESIKIEIQIQLIQTEMSRRSGV